MVYAMRIVEGQYAVLQTVKDACELHPMTLDYAMGDQVEHLSDLLLETEQAADAFFDRNYVTAGMRRLLHEALQRLSGGSDQAVFELKQAMGGGKTHSMLALGLLARNPRLRTRVPADIVEGVTVGAARVVAINGRSISRETFLWGDIAEQLGKKELFARFWRHGADAPAEADWIALLGDEPTLLLLDELPPWFDYAITRVVGGGTLANVATHALSNLLSAALKLKQVCVVLSNLSGAYPDATRDLARAIGDFRQEANRQARSITPVELASNEIYEILKKRLFKKIAPASVVESVAVAYSEAFGEAVRSRTLARPAEQIEEEIRNSYPFHPSVKHVIALFKENESYRQTRGLMQFVSKMIRSVWARPTNDVYLIGCQHLDLNIPEVREELNRISNLQGAISTDVASGGEAHAELIDGTKESDAATQVARLLLTSSLSEAVDAVKGLTQQQVIEILVAPHRSALEFQAAFEDLRRECWYLHRKENDAWYFSNLENLKKRIESCAKTAPAPKIDAEMKRRLENIFEPKDKIAYQKVLALPKLDDIQNLSGPRTCLVISPDSRNPPADAHRLYDAVVEKNNFCVVTGDGSSLGNLEEKVRRIWAVAKVRAELAASSPQIKELEEEAEAAEFDFNSAVVSLFNRLWYPGKAGAGPGLLHARLQIEPDDDTLGGEAAVTKALTATGASKLEGDVTSNGDALLQRAEDLLWQGTATRIPWRDVTSRATTNPRWVWLPPKALDELRRLAMGQGRWRYTEDGYIERGPFPPPRTSVSYHERNYDEQTGVATIAVSARDAGPRGRVHVASQPGVSAASPVIVDEVFDTDATVQYFLAVDPDKPDHTGEPLRWSNKLTITHERKEQLGRRIVELSVVPRGTIRWTTTGANPKEGKPYTAPIDIDGGDEVTLYVYAEQDGVSATRSFRIPKPDQRGRVKCGPGPVRLRKRLIFAGTGLAFALIKAAKDAQASFGGLIVEVGGGARTAMTRFGSESSVLAEHVERLVVASRAALEDDAADVKLTFGLIHFPTGPDLEAFIAGLAIDVTSSEVEE